jgi:hypothetical protein
MSAGRKPLYVSLFRITLQRNVFANCVVTVSVGYGGNAYGGAVSLYIGGYSSMLFKNGQAASAYVGDTVVRNVSVELDTARFESCSARRIFDFHTGLSRGANVYGGSFSFYIGAYAWSQSSDGSSKTHCGGTNASSIFVHVKNITSINSEALSSHSSLQNSIGANSYGGSMSVLYVGAYSWSFSKSASSISMCEATSIIDVTVRVSNFECLNCSAMSTSDRLSYGDNSYGGSMSVLYVGAYSYSWSSSSSTSSKCEATSASGVTVHVSSSKYLNCSALTISTRSSYGANSYGGSISALYVGAYSYSRSNGERQDVFSSASVDVTRALNLSIIMTHVTIADTVALSGERFLAAPANVTCVFRDTDIFLGDLRDGRDFKRCEREFVQLPFPKCANVIVCYFCRFTAGQSV